VIIAAPRSLSFGRIGRRSCATPFRQKACRRAVDLWAPTKRSRTDLVAAPGSRAGRRADLGVLLGHATSQAEERTTEAGSVPACPRLRECSYRSLIKINKSQPRRLSLTVERLHSMGISGIDIHSLIARGFGCVADVPAFGGPGLVIFLTVAPQSHLHPFGEGGEAVSVPFL
jgi:hypothetical protein